jgi:hypothetical protein
MYLVALKAPDETKIEMPPDRWVFSSAWLFLNSAMHDLSVVWSGTLMHHSAVCPRWVEVGGGVTGVPMHGIWRCLFPLGQEFGNYICDLRVRMINHHYSISSVIFLWLSLISVIFRHFFVVMSGTRGNDFYSQTNFHILWIFLKWNRYFSWIRKMMEIVWKFQ